MIMKDGFRIALAVGIGYLLGRTRKLRLALALAGVGAGRRLGGGPGGLVKQGTRLFGSSPEVKALTESVRERLLDAGKAAAVTAANSQIDALSDRIQERTRSLTEPPVPGRTGEREEREAGRGRPEERYEEEEEELREERPRRRPVAARARPPGRRREEEPEEEEEDRPRRPVRPAGRTPVRRTRR